MRGANVMAGYYGDPEASAEVLRDGWLNTGDIGRFDADGYLVLSGRTKDVIVTAAGKNVYPEEVELRYRGLAEVEELVVLGLPPAAAEPEKERRAEVVAAVVVPLPGAGDEAVERIRAALAERSAEVPSYQRIARVEIWRGELPKTTTMKVKRRLLRDAVVAGARSAGKKAAGGGRGPRSAAQVPPDPADAWVIATLGRRLEDRTVARLDRVEDLLALERSA